MLSHIANRIKVLNHLILRWRDYSGLIRCSSIITRVLLCEREMQKWDSARVIQFEECESNVRKTLPDITEFAEARAQVKKYRWTRQEMDSLLELPKRHAALLTP